MEIHLIEVELEFIPFHFNNRVIITGRNEINVVYLMLLLPFFLCEIDSE